jgi:DNA-3-methyladenine glycosylase
LYPPALARLKPRRLKPDFFSRSTLRAARDLIGLLLIHRHRPGPHGVTAGIIVETEAYTGSLDPGSHACRGIGKRNLPMFGPPGRAYVYKCHLYPLLNVVTEREGTPGAVLVRALEPVAGLPLMRRRRKRGNDLDLARGPGKLCQALAVGLKHNRADLIRGKLFLARPEPLPGIRIRRSTRIGLAGPAALLPWRFFASGSPCVSRHPDALCYSLLRRR